MQETNARSKLRPVNRKGAWYARGSIPVRQGDGSIARKRAEISLGADLSRQAREKECDRLNKFYEQRALSTQAHLTFARAYTNYVDAGRDHPLLGAELVKAIGAKQCVDINDTDMNELRHKLFLADAKPSYINRHLYSPVIAILNMAAKITRVKPALTRPKGHKSKVQLRIPDADWFRELRPHLNDRQAALVAFLTAHGRRLGDALNLKVRDFNYNEGTVYVGKDKTGMEVFIELVPLAADLMCRMGLNPDLNAPLFGWQVSSASSIRRDLKLACKRAGLEWFSPHKFGRHTFATRMLRAGYSLQHVKDAGGWATIEMVSERYGHLAQKEVTKAVHDVAATIEFSGGGNLGENENQDLKKTPKTAVIDGFLEAPKSENPRPPKAEVTGSNPVGCAKNPSKSTTE
jgi:integrase